MNVDLEALKQAALAADKGVWAQANFFIETNGGIVECVDDHGNEHRANTHFIALAYPEAILELIARLEDRTRDIQRQAEEIERLRAERASAPVLRLEQHEREALNYLGTTLKAPHWRAAVDHALIICDHHAGRPQLTIDHARLHEAMLAGKVPPSAPAEGERKVLPAELAEEYTRGRKDGWEAAKVDSFGGYVIEHADGDRWRTLDSVGAPDWTDDKSEALCFSLRKHADAFACDDPEDVRIVEAAALSQAQELDRLRALINSPEVDAFLRGTHIEAVYQVERWGAASDRAKRPADWFWLVGYLAGKALHAAMEGSTEKAKHHTISSAAALYNWHSAITGNDVRMCPGRSDLAQLVDQQFPGEAPARSEVAL